MNNSIKLRRVGAIILDALFVGIMTAIIAVFLRTFGLIPTNYLAPKYVASIALFKKPFIIELVVAIIVAFIMHTVVPILMQGATLGKKICAIRVVGQNGQTATPLQLVIRNFFVYFAVLALLGFIANPAYQHYLKTNQMDLEHLTEYYENARKLINPMGALLSNLPGIIQLIMFIMLFTSGGHKLLNDMLAKTTVELEADTQQG